MPTERCYWDPSLSTTNRLTAATPQPASLAKHIGVIPIDCGEEPISFAGRIPMSIQASDAPRVMALISPNSLVFSPPLVDLDGTIGATMELFGSEQEHAALLSSIAHCVIVFVSSASLEDSSYFSIKQLEPRSAVDSIEFVVPQEQDEGFEMSAEAFSVIEAESRAHDALIDSLDRADGDTWTFVRDE